MTPRLRSSFTLLAVLPLTLDAQVLAGDATGLAHTSVGIVLVPAFGGFPLMSNDTASIDLQGDGWMDLRFDATNIHVFDADGSGTGFSMLHAGLEVAVDVPGGYVAQRLDLLAPVDSSLTWRAYSDVTGSALVLASMYTNFAGQWDTTGVGQWFFNATTTTHGYVGVRTVQGNDTLYGWVNLISFVSQDSSWLQIDDFAIETGTTGISDEPAPSWITASLSRNGALLVQGREGELLSITLRDGSGRMVRQVAGPSPCLLDIADEARGIYFLTVNERSRSRSFKLAR